MGDRRIHLFAGPSLAATSPPQLAAAGIVVHPPARRGDIKALVATDSSATIALADGFFHQQPAVGHAEIRDAIRGGACIWGLCSIGAIRAAEMNHLGLRGFGDVFHAYRADPSLPDDEVALLHSPKAPYRAISEPMIHWRRYFRALEGSGLLDPVASERIQADLADRWFGDRTLERGAKLLARLGSIFIEPSALDRALEPHRIKLLDLLKFIRSRPWDSNVPASYATEEMHPASPVDLTAIGGLPFIDQSFDAMLFLSAVSGTRAGMLGGIPAGSRGYSALLEPKRIISALTTRLTERDFFPPHTELTATDRRRVDLALRRVKASSRMLGTLFDLPVRLLRWKSGKVSMTNPFIPQTIFLGEGAMQSTFGMLEEVIVHEFAHVWLGMLCEVLDLQKHGSKQVYILPSGTDSKDARGVLLATHFAGAVITYLIDSAESVPLVGRRAERLHYLQWYLRHALQIPITSDLTPMGWAVFERLRQFDKFHARGV